MMKIWSMKQNAAAEEKKKPKVSAAQIRVQKDLTELSLPSTMKTTFPNPEDLLNFQLSIRPDEGEFDCMMVNSSPSPGISLGDCS